MTLPKLYACMMMKDEAHNLDRCLSSIRELCDEIVIVDTGSTDKSIEIARKYGAIVYPGAFNWRKPPIFDFSLHRNSGLQYCQELGADWVLIIDADEELKPMEADPEEFKRKLSKIEHNIHAIGTLVHENRNGEFSASWWGVRFFRVKENCHYDGRVHNHPHLVDGFSAASDVVVYHYGYTNKCVMEKKRERTLLLLENRLKEDPDDHEALYYKAITMVGQGRFEEAVEIGEQAIRRLNTVVNGDPTKLEFYGRLYFVIGSSYLKLWHKNRRQEYGDLAFQWLSKGLEFYPNDIDLNYYMCFLYGAAGDKEKVKEHADRYRKSIEQYKSDTDVKLDKFANIVILDNLALNARGVYCADESYQRNIDKIVEIT